ncbi:hypothetical protein NDU88_003075 [Pleurodeles waltl]|uniref:Uncharacterized protein n=1 Tax=Pleurodeles waltl TaxID=8319 RepID=A0AAV7SER2_PLEWA|nr:hypothetical protein NDU88_003075 [Pleurodeles waltl]
MSPPPHRELCGHVRLRFMVPDSSTVCCRRGSLLGVMSDSVRFRAVYLLFRAAAAFCRGLTCAKGFETVTPAVALQAHAGPSNSLLVPVRVAKGGRVVRRCARSGHAPQRSVRAFV